MPAVHLMCADASSAPHVGWCQQCTSCVLVPGRLCASAVLLTHLSTGSVAGTGRKRCRLVYAASQIGRLHEAIGRPGQSAGLAQQGSSASRATLLRACGPSRMQAHHGACTPVAAAPTLRGASAAPSAWAPGCSGGRPRCTWCSRPPNPPAQHPSDKLGGTRAPSAASAAGKLPGCCNRAGASQAMVIRGVRAGCVRALVVHPWGAPQATLRRGACIAPESAGASTATTHVVVVP